jgi:hypothetical protein
MSLTALEHRRMAVVNVVTATTAGLLDHIYTAITAANDYAGNALTSPLVGVTKYQNAGTTEAVYGSFTTGALTHKFLIAGVNAARTPLMGGSHTYSSQMLMGGLTKNAGAFASWDHATLPFTSGQSTGLVKFFDPSSVTAIKVHAYISAETLWIFIERDTNLIFGIGLGALIDPETTSSLSAESDGRIYGVISTGTTSINTGLHNQTSGFLIHNASNNTPHNLFFNAGAGTLQNTSRVEINQAVSSTTTLVNADNEPFALPIFMKNATTDKMIGRLREFRVVRDSKHGLKQGSDTWYYVGGSTVTDVDCFGLMY